MICIYLLDIPLSSTLHLIYKIFSVFCTLIFIYSVVVIFVCTPQLFNLSRNWMENTYDCRHLLLWEKGLKTMLWHSWLKLKLCFSPASRGSWYPCWPKDAPTTNMCVHDVPSQVFFILDWGDGHVVLHLWARKHIICKTEWALLLLLSSDLI